MIHINNDSLQSLHDPFGKKNVTGVLTAREKVDLFKIPTKDSLLTISNFPVSCTKEKKKFFKLYGEIEIFF